MTAALPAPLTPPGLDLSGYSGFLLDTKRLLSSDLWAMSTGDQLKAALALWCRAWSQVPAASLPNDDRMLAKLAGVSRAKWRHLKAVALHGFVLCTDGRLYHPVLAKDALRAAAAMVKRVAEGVRGRAKQIGQAVQRQLRLPVEPREIGAKSPPDFSRKPLKSLDPPRARGSIPSSTATASGEVAASEPVAAALRGDLPEVDLVLAAVEREVAEAWPDGERRRHAGDRGVVEGWLDSGMAAGQIAGAVRVIARRDAARGRQPPTSLRYYAAAMKAAPAASRAAQEPSWRPGCQWTPRMDVWRSKGVWLRNYWGPAPGEAGCEVPAALLA